MNRQYNNGDAVRIPDDLLYFDPGEPSIPDRFLALLADPRLPDRVGVSWISLKLGRPWRELRTILIESRRVRRELEGKWTYVGGIGCKARSHFVRTARVPA
jgi:hypothetical protein